MSSLPSGAAQGAAQAQAPSSTSSSTSTSSSSQTRSRPPSGGSSHDEQVQMHRFLRGMSFDEGESMLRPDPRTDGAATKGHDAPVQMEKGDAPDKGAPVSTESGPTMGGAKADAGAAAKGDTKTADAAKAKETATAGKEAGAEKKADTTEKKAPPPAVKTSTSTVMKKDAALSLLQGAFGTYKTMVAGDVRVLAQADFQVAYEAIYGTTQYAWATYVVPTFGNLNGFAYGGVNYINQDAADVTTTPHEMLHNNVASDWRGVVGSPFDEGATEYLEQYALRVGKIPNAVMTHYPNQKAVVEAYLGTGRTEADLFTAYLKGGAAKLVKEHVDAKCKKAWADVKKSTEESKWAEAKAGLALK